MRLQISFRPAVPQPDIVSATTEYEGLWAAHGDEIVARLETHTGLQFVEREVQAQIGEGPSRSHPLQLRASYDRETKLGTLIHELAHRLIVDAAPPAARGLESHEVIYLFLFDVWTDLFGRSFAERQVQVESQRRPLYAEAWRTAHRMDRTARAARLRTLVAQREAGVVDGRRSDQAEIERILAACERDPSRDLARAGFWRAVGAVKRDRTLVERYADRIGRLDRAAFERRVPLRVPIGVGLALHVASIAIGFVLCALALAPEGASPLATSPLREIVFIGASQGLIGVVHTLAHWLVGSLVGIRFTHAYTALARRPQPGIKIDYASYLRTPARARAWMHASGAIATKLLAFAAAAVAARAGLAPWSVWALVAFGAVAIVIDLTLSTRASDWKRFLREMRAA